MRLLTWKQLQTEFGYPYSRVHTYRLIAAGSFPLPLKLGKFRGARVVWVRQEVEDWLKLHLEQRSP